MKYYKGIQLLEYPHIMWNEIAEFATIEEFEDSEWASDPLVKPESDIEQVFGTYSFRIVDGAFVDWNAEQLADLESAFNVKNLLALNRKRIETLNEGTFVYDGKTFPMDAASREFFRMMPIVLGNQKIYDTSGILYSLDESDIPAFMNAFHSKVYTLTQHDD